MPLFPSEKGRIRRGTSPLRPHGNSVASRERNKRWIPIQGAVMGEIVKEIAMAGELLPLADKCPKCSFHHGPGPCIRVRHIPEGFSYAHQKDGVTLPTSMRNSKAPDRARARNREQRSTMKANGHRPPVAKKKKRG